MPWAYFQVRFFQPPTMNSVRTFTMTPNNTWVIHLESDVKRWELFQQQDPQWSVQIFPATRVSIPAKAASGKKRRIRRPPSVQSSVVNNSDAQQDYWIQTYPSIQHAISRGKYGDAGVSISHLRLWKEWLQNTSKSHSNSDSSYLFVFEDDALLSRQLLSSKQVMVPADADVIWLMKSVAKAVRVPFRNNKTIQTASRVLKGAGTYGYIITRHGAQTALREVLLGTHHLRIYLPLSGWPQVLHSFRSASSKWKFNV